MRTIVTFQPVIAATQVEKDTTRNDAATGDDIAPSHWAIPPNEWGRWEHRRHRNDKPSNQGPIAHPQRLTTKSPQNPTRPKAETLDRDERATTHHSRQKFTRNPCLASQYGSPHTISGSFNSIFKVLFSFPSLYFFAIGLSIVFSLGRDLPPIFGLYSQTNLLIQRVAQMTNGIRHN